MMVVVGGAAVGNAGMLMMVVAVQPSTQVATRPLGKKVPGNEVGGIDGVDSDSDGDGPISTCI